MWKIPQSSIKTYGIGITRAALLCGEGEIPPPRHVSAREKLRKGSKETLYKIQGGFSY
jgi:hypothetical protein